MDLFANRPVEHDRHDVSAGAAERTTDLLARHSDQHRRMVGAEFDERRAESDLTGGRAVSHGGAFSGLRTDRGDPSAGDHDVAQALVADRHEVGPNGHHPPPDRAAGGGADRDIGPALGEVDQEPDNRRVLCRLTFESALPGPLGRSRVDPAVGKPRREARKWVVAGEAKWLARWRRVHEARGYRYHSW